MNVTIRSLIITFGLMIGSLSALFGQTEAYIQGYVKNANGKPVSSVSIIIENTNTRVISNDSGFYQIKTYAYKQLTLKYTCIGYQSIEQKIRLQPRETAKLDVILPVIMRDIQEISIVSEAERAANQNRVSMKDFSQIPNASGNFESIIKTMPGVSSSNELSSQYSVRGGNFDENIVYVNDIEIERPFLIRSGQQEGLSFINPEMVSSVKFSAGGFESRYGDKMSSVLDVTYNKPTANQYSLSAGLLGATATVEGISKNAKFSYIGGIRYKTSKYLLNTMETKGEYSPAFIDVQSLINYQVSSKLELSILGNFAQNRYQFIPLSRSTNFGVIGNILNLTVYYDGQEMDKYQSALSAFSMNYKPAENLSLKFISSVSSSYEQETFDIEGYYLVNELDNSYGTSTFGDSLLNIGVGGQLDHARNYLWANSWTLSHIGLFLKGQHSLRWGFEYKNESVKDKLKEWTYMDSTGYSKPYSPSSIQLTDYASAKNNLMFLRLSGYFQDTYQFSIENTRFYLNGGIRFNYMSYNKQFVVSPRIRFSIKPDWKRDFMFYIASGIYYQPPSYKEMRDFHGNLNTAIKAQQSIHIVAGSDYNLRIWNRPFKFTSEIYYKFLNNLIPYKIDNVRIRYSAKNNTSGYATGMDFKLNGEFVPGIESWASLSFLKTEENQRDDYYLDTEGNRINPGSYPRPTDQRVMFSLFFQDYLPNNPTLQLHLNLAYGSPVHISPPRDQRFDQTFAMGPYRRVDLGLSKTIKDKNKKINPQFLGKVEEMTISLDIFNLLNINNKASYLWVQTVNNQNNESNEFAIPNYLTSRRINVRLSVKF